jgi:3-polyprenyl-4-hydroxybenzoate decarboxylase
VPSVVSTSWFHGGGPTTVVISLRKLTDGLPMRAALAVMAASNMIKQVIVVDEDIDPRDPHEVLWAVSTRMQADRDVTILKGLQGSVLDPSLGSSLSTSGMVIDATKPLDRPYPAKVRVPPDALRRYPLDRYLTTQAVAEARRALIATDTDGS